MLELSEAIRDYHDHTGLPQVVSLDSLCAVPDIVYWLFIDYINHVGACTCVVCISKGLLFVCYIHMPAL